jgi:hypothetical protein
MALYIIDETYYYYHFEDDPLVRNNFFRLEMFSRECQESFDRFGSFFIRWKQGIQSLPSSYPLAELSIRSSSLSFSVYFGPFWAITCFPHLKHLINTKTFPSILTIIIRRLFPSIHYSQWTIIHLFSPISSIKAIGI